VATERMVNFEPLFRACRCSQGERVLYARDLSFGRSRESRTREAAGRRNWPEAVARKMSGRKRTIISAQ